MPLLPNDGKCTKEWSSFLCGGLSVELFFFLLINVLRKPYVIIAATNNVEPTANAMYPSPEEKVVVFVKIQSSQSSRGNNRPLICVY